MFSFCHLYHCNVSLLKHKNLARPVKIKMIKIQKIKIEKVSEKRVGSKYRPFWNKKLWKYYAIPKSCNIRLTRKFLTKVFREVSLIFFVNLFIYVCLPYVCKLESTFFTVHLSPPELQGRFSSFLFLTMRLIELHR